jgi:DNA modification methylase
VRRVRKAGDEGHLILAGDAREVLRSLPEGSAQCCVTSPPYWGLRDYGTEPTTWGGEEGCGHDKWVKHRYYVVGGGSARSSGEAFSEAGEGNAERIKKARWREDDTCARCGAWRGQLGLEPTVDLYVDHIVEVLREVARVLRDDGTMWLNLGDCYAGSTKQSGRNDAGNNFRPGRVEAGNKTKIKVDLELLGLKHKDLVGVPWRVAFALQADGWWLRSDIIWAKPNPMPESCRDRPTKSHEYVFLLTRSARYYWDQEAIREQDTGQTGTSANFQRRRAGPIPPGQSHASLRPNRKPTVASGTRNARSVWTIPTQPFPEAHFATFPERLAERCIMAGTSERGCCPECGAGWVRVFSRMLRTFLGWRPTCGCGGEAKSAEKTHPPVPCTVIDPFVGSGTTAIVAARLGRRAVGIDLSPKYVEMVRKQIAVTSEGSARRPRKYRLKARRKIRKVARRGGGE